MWGEDHILSVLTKRNTPSAAIGVALVGGVALVASAGGASNSDLDLIRLLGIVAFTVVVAGSTVAGP